MLTLLSALGSANQFHGRTTFCAVPAARYSFRASSCFPSGWMTIWARTFFAALVAHRLYLTTRPQVSRLLAASLRRWHSIGGRNAMRLLKLLLVLLVCAAGPAVAGPIEDAAGAYVRGDYATALRLLRPLAEQGNPGGQYNLGALYERGNGVPQDYVQALKWYSLAASRLGASQLETSDAITRTSNAVAAKMTPAQIAEAQKLAREWKPK